MTAAIELATAFRHPERSAILGGVAALGFGMVVGRRVLTTNTPRRAIGRRPKPATNARTRCQSTPILGQRTMKPAGCTAKHPAARRAGTIGRHCARRRPPNKCRSRPPEVDRLGAAVLPVPSSGSHGWRSSAYYGVGSSGPTRNPDPTRAVAKRQARVAGADGQLEGTVARTYAGRRPVPSAPVDRCIAPIASGDACRAPRDRRWRGRPDA
jgi:hypothetical protein